MNQDKIDTSEKKELTQKQKLVRRGIPALIAVGAVTGLGVAYADDGLEAIREHNTAQFSDEALDTHTINEGETYWSVAGLIEGVDQIDKTEAVAYIKSLPENDNLESTLYPGDQVYYPDHVVKP